MILRSPLSEETVRSLKIGDLVYVSGTVVTGRDAVHMRALEYLREGKRTPSELQGSTLYHCGPIIEGG
ncbi:MAG: fumarate hydratase C-terminal domain-containing protein, partial [Candidatus Methanomethylophilaceae archaeon]